jgi:hypothetical protein
MEHLIQTLRGPKPHQEVARVLVERLGSPRAGSRAHDLERPHAVLDTFHSLEGLTESLGTGLSIDPEGRERRRSLSEGKSLPNSLMSARML